MTEPASEDYPPGPRPPAAYGRRTRLAVAITGCLLSLGMPVSLLSAPGLTANQQTVRVPDDPAGLGITGAPPGDPLASDPTPGLALDSDGLPIEPSGIELPGIPTPPDLPDGPLGIPGAVLDAYQFAQRTLAEVRPGCHLPWSVLAGIGRIESNHASDGRVDAFGNTLGPILGPVLDGSPGIAAVPDTDRGTLDGDTVWDRAVGPMQFIPSTWRSYGVDGNGDGVANPNNIYDATVATGLYLCAGGTDLSDPAQLQAAVFRYNHSAAYVNIVLLWAHAYLTGVVPTASAPGPVPPGTNGNGGRVILPDDAAPMASPTPSPSLTASVPATPVPTSSLEPTPTASPTTPSPDSPSPVPSTTPVPSPTPAPSTTPEPSANPEPSTTASAVPSPIPSASPLPVTATTPVSPSPLPAPSPMPSPLPPSPHP